MTSSVDDLLADHAPSGEGGPPSRRNRRDERPRWGRRILAIVLGFLLLVGASIGAYLLYLNHTVTRNITQEKLLPEPAPTPELGTQPAPVVSAGTNYLLIGSDARPGDSFSRSDVIIIAHIPDDHSKIYLIHFPRDLYVDIPGHGKDKINASFAYGGAPLLVKTLQNLLDIKIDHVAKTGFDGFERMTNAMGGVRVWAEEPSSTPYGDGAQLEIHKGWNELNGEQALAFVRERHQLSEGDISRGRRQQAFLKALMLKAISPSVLTNPVKILNLADAATRNLVIDQTWSVADMRSTALDLRNIRSKDIVFVTAPFTGFGTAPNGGSIDIVDEAGMAELGNALRTGTMADYTDVSSIP